MTCQDNVDHEEKNYKINEHVNLVSAITKVIWAIACRAARSVP